MRDKFRFRLRLTSALLPVVLLCACVDLSEVGKFADISDSANASFPALVADIQGSCERRAGFAPQSQREAVLTTCKAFATSRPGLLQAQQVLLDYMGALKGLSSNDSVTYGARLDALPDALSKTGFDATQVAATTSLAKKLADAALNGYRRKELAKIIGQSNDDVKTLTSALKTIVTKDYERELSQEEEGTDDFYKTSLKEHGSGEPLTVILVERLRVEDLRKIAEKKTAAAAYGDVMDSIAQGHQKLFDTRNSWSTRTVLEDLAPIVNDLYKSTRDVYKAFR